MVRRSRSEPLVCGEVGCLRAMTRVSSFVLLCYRPAEVLIKTERKRRCGYEWERGVWTQGDDGMVRGRQEGSEGRSERRDRSAAGFDSKSLGERTGGASGRVDWTGLN